MRKFETKGKLVERFIDCHKELENARKLKEKLEKEHEALAYFISADDELSSAILNGGIVTIFNDVVQFDVVTEQIRVFNCPPTSSITSKLTDEQFNEICAKLKGGYDER